MVAKEEKFERIQNRNEGFQAHQLIELFRLDNFFAVGKVCTTKILEPSLQLN